MQNCFSFWGTKSPRPPPRKGHSPQFSAYISCGQMAPWIKMPLGRKIGLYPSNIVLDGNPAPPPQKGDTAPIFGPCLLCPNGWMDQHALGVEVGHGPGHIVLDGNLLPFPEKGAQPPFSAHVFVAKRLDGSRCHLVQR